MTVVKAGAEKRPHIPADLAPAADEASVLSVVAVWHGANWVLASGSLLTVPREVAACSWVAWGERQPETRSWAGRQGFDFGPTFVTDPFRGVRLARQIVEPSEWPAVVDAIASGTYVSSTLRFVIRADRWSSTVYLGISGLTPAHEAVDGAQRPVSGVFASLEDVGQREGVKGIWELVLPPHVSPGRELGEMYRNRSMTQWATLVGVDWAAPEISGPPAAFVVGRTRSEAWMARVRPEYKTAELKIHICWDAQVIDPLSCSLLIRSEHDGVSVLTRHIRISDLPAGDEKPPGEPRLLAWDQRVLTVSVPRGPRRTDWGATLLGPDGRLLDELPVAPRIESIHLALSIDGSSSVSESVVGDRDGPPDPSQRDEAVAQAVSLEEAGRGAAARRRISTAGELERYLRWRFSCVEGELLIIDPHLLVDARAGTDVLPFLQRLDRPVRAIVRSIHPTVAAGVGVGARIEARLLPNGTRTAHDRVWIVRDTGLLVGGSANTFIPARDRGSSPATTVSELPHGDVQEWRRRFEHWWGPSKST
jgi:hypothetical protein